MCMIFISSLWYDVLAFDMIRWRWESMSETHVCKWWDFNGVLSQQDSGLWKRSFQGRSFAETILYIRVPVVAEVPF